VESQSKIRSGIPLQNVGISRAQAVRAVWPWSAGKNHYSRFGFSEPVNKTISKFLLDLKTIFHYKSFNIL
jgi:hypothetical protein